MIDQLHSFLRKAKEDFSHLRNIRNLEDRKTDVISILESCLKILNYTVNNFPGIKEKLPKKKIYFPRYCFLESSKDSFQRIKEDFCVIESDDFYKFIKKAYSVICVHKKAVLYINSEIKHKTPPKITGSEVKHSINYQVRSNTKEDPIKIDDNGISIGNFVRAEKGAKVQIYNSQFIENERVIEINQLSYHEIKIQGKDVFFKNGEKRDLKKWLNDCINTCKGIVDIFQQEVVNK